MSGFFAWLASGPKLVPKSSVLQPIYATSPSHPKVGQWFPRDTRIGGSGVRCMECGTLTETHHLVEVAPPIAAAAMCRVLSDKYDNPPPTGVG